jgi:phage gp29-like protein
MQKGLYINPTTFVPINQISEGLTSEIATRQFATGGFAGFFNYLPDPDPILRKLGMDQTVYKDLLADDQVGPLFNRRKNLTKSLDYYIEQNDAGDAEVELCELAMQTLEAGGSKIKDIISQSLNPIGFGYGVYEFNLALVKGKWLPTSLWEKPREWFHFDSENRLRFRTIGNYEGQIIIGKDADPKITVKFILLQNDPSYENPYGDKALSRCFWPVTFKRGGMKFFSTFIEKYGMPFIYGKLPRGAKPSDHNDLLSKLMNMVQDAVATGPDDSSLQLIEIKGTTSGDLYEKYLQRCDNSITKAILGNALSTELQKVGSRASTETGAIEIEGDIGQTDRDFPTTLFNELFRRVIDINIGSGKYPTFAFVDVEDSKKDFAERDKIISEAFSSAGQKIKRTKSFLINRYGYEDDEFEVVDQETPAEPKQINPVLAAPSNDEPPISLMKRFANKILRSKIEFAAGSPSLKTSEQIVNSIPEKLLQFQMESVMKPIIELAKNSNSKEDLQKELIKVFPDMDSRELEDFITKALFIAEIEGRINASK